MSEYASTDAPAVAAQSTATRVDAGPLVVAGVSKRYGQTVAVSEMSLEISPGRVVGLIGPNGAGKSTLMRIVAGETVPDEGSLSIAGRAIELARFSPQVAHELGVRFVHQELSLCSNLRVFENFLVEFGRELGSPWRRHARRRAEEAIELAFPGSGISAGAAVGSLTLAQRQIVEIAKAASTESLRLLILDEPTSALPADAVEQLRVLLGRLRERRVMMIFITHRLSEVLSLTDSIVVMRGGTAAWTGTPAEVTRDDLVRLMGGRAVAQRQAPSRDRVARRAGRRVLDVTELTRGQLRGVTLHVDDGEVVGVYGLEGSGQRELLRAVYGAGGARCASRARSRS